jgi:hypothetical protein
MTLQPVTVRLPKSLYNQIRRRAEISARTLEEELLDVVASAIPSAEGLPEEMTNALSALDLLDGEALLRAAHSHLPAEAVQEMESLHLKRQEHGLNEFEKQTLAGLLQQYERSMLVRAQAAAILKQRGQDISGLLK